MIFLTADMHFNHKNIIKEDFGPHHRSQFSSVDEMNNLIIENWKKKVSNDDTVYILGDIALGDPNVAIDIISNLPGKKILLMGNHDVPKIKTKKHSKTAPQDLEHLKYPQELFEQVYPASESIDISYKKYSFVLNHYPPTVFLNDSLQDHRILLHAHSHSKKEYNMANMALHIPVYDVGVDANDFSPISIDDLFNNMVMWTKEGQIKCKDCGSVMKVRSGPYGRFLGCSNYPACKTIYNSIKTI